MTEMNLAPPPAVSEIPRLRFWGDRRPPKNRADMFSVRMAAGDSDGSLTVSAATLRLYGPIDSWGGWWGISAKDVAAALDSLGDVDEIHVRINSPGGEVWEGLTILNMLRAHPAKVVAVVDGLAASAASVIATGCDETVMSPGTQLMVHDASGFAFGPEATMLKAAQFLSSTSNSVASVYADKAGGTDEAWRGVMREETWYTAKEAVDSGLADRVGIVTDDGSIATAGDDDVDVTVTVDVDVEDRFDLSMYEHAGRSHAPAPTAIASDPKDKPGRDSGPSPLPKPSSAFQTCPAEPVDGTTPPTDQEVTVSDDTNQGAEAPDLRAGLVELGILKDATADGPTALAAIKEALEERAEPVVVNQAVPEGTVAVSEGVLAELRAQAALGVEAHARQVREDRETALTMAVNKGQITPAERDRWKSKLEADPESITTLQGLPEGLVPVEPIGHAINTSADDALLVSLGFKGV